MAKTEENLSSTAELKGRPSSVIKNETEDEEQRYDPLFYCRTCASKDASFVSIFKGEGLNHQLNKKIEKYLPINVTKDDDLPLQLCYNCASTIIAWDALIIGCVEAEKKLISLKNGTGKFNCVKNVNEEIHNEADEPCAVGSDNIDSDDEPLITKKLAVAKSSKRKKNSKKEALVEKIETEGCLTDDVIERLVISQDILTSPSQLLPELVNIGLNRDTYLKVYSMIKRTVFSSHIDVIDEVDDISEFDKGNLEESISRTDRKKREKVNESKFARCEDCGKTLSSKMSLNNHKKIHSNETTMTCHVCGKAFRHRFSLERHLKVVHEGVRKYSCDECGRKYRSRGEMQDHRNVHDTRQKIVCEVCGRIFLTKASFYPHIKSHRTKKFRKVDGGYACRECNKILTTRKSRNQHMLIHTGEKPLLCEICDKSFRTKANYSQHMKIHTGVKPFACEHCGKRFGRKDHLTIHVRCHTGEKPFVCSFCGRAFAQMSDMKKHGRLHRKLDLSAV